MAYSKIIPEKNNLPSIPAFGYGAGGAGNIKHFLQMAKDLNIRAVAIYDGDHADEKAATEKKFPEALIELLPTPDVRDKPKRNEEGKELEEITKEGLFDRHGSLKPTHAGYVRGLLERIEKWFGR